MVLPIGPECEQNGHNYHVRLVCFAAETDIADKGYIMDIGYIARICYVLV